MFDDLHRVAKRNRTSAGVIASLQIAAVFLIVGGGWMGWFLWQVSAGVFVGFAVSLVTAGLALGGEANRRLAINRVVGQFLAALPSTR